MPSYLKMICVKTLSYLTLSTHDRTRMLPLQGTGDNSNKWLFLMKKKDLPVLQLFASKESEDALKREQEQEPTLAVWERMQSMLADANFPIEPVGGSPVIDVAALSHELRDPFFNVLRAMRVFSKTSTCDDSRKGLLVALNAALEAVSRLGEVHGGGGGGGDGSDGGGGGGGSAPLAAALRTLDGVLVELTRSPTPNP